MTTIKDSRFVKLIEQLKNARESKNITQQALADKMSVQQSFVAKVEGLERKLDVIELYDWLSALDYDKEEFFRSIGWFVEKNKNSNLPALPIPKTVKPTDNGILMQLAWQGEVKEVLLENVTVEQYLAVEKQITSLFESLNSLKPNKKNREAICDALELAVQKMPTLNPSDIYHHIIYRLYLREYSKTQADRSWVRAGGEAVELFVEKHYQPQLSPHNITVKALITSAEKKNALDKMGLTNDVGGSKLDVVLIGTKNNEEVVFGGIHIKASLAERVSDDVPCSEAMMKKGLLSILFTFDAKSFPPPAGDLVNKGELGSLENPSDKRKYIEEHGSFDACFSYNLRSVPSGGSTTSGKKIYVSSFDTKQDSLVKHVVDAWKKYCED